MQSEDHFARRPGAAPIATSKTHPANGARPVEEATIRNPARSPEVLNLIVRLVNLALSLSLHSTALFLAERYHCLCPLSEEAVFLKALSLLRNEEHRQALELLKNTIVDLALAHSAAVGFNTSAGTSRITRRPAYEASIRCAWVFSEACLALGRPNEGSEALKNAQTLHGSRPAWRLSIPERTTFPSNSPANASVSISLSLAKLALQANKPDVAAQKYNEVLKLAWWSWEAYEGLCLLGKAPDADTLYGSIPVPEVPEPPTATFATHDAPISTFALHHDQNAASSAAPASVALQVARTNSQDPQLRGSSQLPPAPSSSTATPTHQLQGQRPEAPNKPFTSTFTFQALPVGGTGSSSFGGVSFGPRSHDKTTPADRNAPGFRFGEPANLEDDRSQALDSANNLNGDSVSLDDLRADDSSFFGAGRNPPAGASKLAGGLFGFARQTASSNFTSGRTVEQPAFGSGRFFNAQGTSSSNAAPVNGASISGGSFFTPISQPHAVTSALLQAKPPKAHSPSAMKRNRTEVDVDDSIPSFQYSARGTAGGAAESDFFKGRNGHASVHSGITDDSEMLEQDVQMNDGQTRASSSAMQVTGSREATINGQAALRKGLGGSSSSTSAAGLSRRTSRPNGQQNALPPLNLSKPDADSDKYKGTPFNTREKKRSKAGPSNYEDTTASSLDSATADTPHLSPRPYFVSSSPPASSSQPPLASSSTLNIASSTPSTNITASSSAIPAAPSPVISTSMQARPKIHARTASHYRQQVESSQKAIAENWLRSIYRGFGKATSAMSRFDCLTCIKSVLSLPAEQQRSPRAILLLGRAHFESLDYAKAEQAFLSLRSVAPYSSEGMEIYSTLLWHLHKPTELSFLAQELMAISNRLPCAWIATGNVFSHLEDHPNALKSFKRAIQSGPDFPYSYTLAGHECVTMEEWETAMGFFREAIKRQPRHYNAWFGLGNVYMKTGKYRLAEYHFRKAVEINPSNAMLVSCVGTAYEKSGDKKLALEMYERACLLAPKSPAVRFKRVRMLMEMRQLNSALRDLLIVRDLAPDEFNVHFLLGKLYGALGDKTNMTRSLTFAQDLEPRAAGRIREIIERAGAASDEEDEGDDESQARRDDAGRQGGDGSAMIA